MLSLTTTISKSLVIRKYVRYLKKLELSIGILPIDSFRVLRIKFLKHINRYFLMILFETLLKI